MSRSIAEWLVAQWTMRFGEILLTMGDLQPQMHVEHIDESAIKGGLLWWEQPFTCTPDSPIWTGAPEETWAEIGKLVLAAAGVEGGPTSEIQSTYLEIVRQSMSSLGTDIGQRIGTTVNCSKGAETTPRKLSRQVFHVEAELPDKTVVLTLIVADDLCHTIAAAENKPAEPEPSMELAPIPMDGTLGSRTFELLLDVELPVSVSFGRTTLKLQEAIRLITGSLIELDRGLNDPVELLVNNCVIARGEVVVVEGNYGVRITEIISQKERLQQTRRYMLQ
jgi:flagellar motor switch protein FliN/FliY